MQKRYDQLLDLVDEAKPQSIVEIGVWNGKRACLMAERALKHHDEVWYVGYDLFEEASAETDVAEMNAKQHNSVEAVTARLNDFAHTNPGFRFRLVKGNTRETLVDTDVDFAYIDGGHSVETIRSDYEHVKASRVVVFDDYYLPGPKGNCVDLNKFGANRIVDAIEGAEVLPSEDKMTMAEGGVVALAVVRREGFDSPTEPEALPASDVSE
jgi:predicted O-methyltransferase YrrM